MRHDVPRIVYASSNHAVGRTPRSAPALGADVSRAGRTPTTASARWPPRRCCTCTSTATASTPSAPGSARSSRRPTTRRQLSTWLSHDDAVRMFHAALTAPSPGFAVVYGISANTRAWWDLAPGRALGYDPAGRRRGTSPPRSSPSRRPSSDRAEAAHVGGPFATGEFDRPAFD